ncbi:hypothetical protein AGMMS49928_00650 [Spirochaetia bacterium]|nr:hypothetical protein AGMMS49928_00650 [Spirochaetia bacterium]
MPMDTNQLINQPILSIITISRWNDSELDKTIKSVNNGFCEYLNKKKVEHIIVCGEDCVIDDTIPGRYYYTAPPKGIYNAMNYGLYKANGEWIWFLNAGDECITGISNNLLQALESCTGEVMKCGVNITDNNSSRIWFGKIISPHPGTLYKTHVLRKINGFREDFKIISDQLVFDKLLLKRVKMIDAHLVIVNFYENGVSSSIEGKALSCKERLKYTLECPVNIISWYRYIRTVQGYLKAKFS